MCGRYTQRSEGPQLVRRFDATRSLFDPPVRFNIAPSQTVAIVTPGSPGSPDGDGRELRPAAWGFVPSWQRAGDARPLINARGETVDTLRSFRDAFATRRCLIPADGFYEWKRTTGGGKTPMFIHRNEPGPFAFAGLYEPSADDPDAPPTCVIITTDANDLVASIHNRMPVILPHDAESHWLDGDAASLRELLRPYDPALMSMHPVSRRVNKPAADDPTLIERVDNEAGTQGELFG